MAQLVHNPTQVMILPGAPNPNAKDSRWLTLEVCREFQRSKCSRSDNECKFAHPPPHVEVQNGRVVACFDSLKGKCQRKDPPCKYLHPPQHLREQLLQNGRNNLILKNLQIQAYHQQAQYAGVLPMAYEAGTKTVAVPTVMPGQYSYLTHYPGLQALSAVPAQAPATYSPYLTSLASVAMPTSADANSIMSHQLQHNMITTKAMRADKFETTSDSGDTLTTHASLMDSYSYPTYISQQSTIPGMVPAYKRIAVGDISKGGIPVYQTSQLMSPLQPTSLMQLQQPPSYIQMSFAGHPHSVQRF